MPRAVRVMSSARLGAAVLAAIAVPSAVADVPTIVEAGWSVRSEVAFERPVAPHFSPVDGMIYLGRAETSSDGLYRFGLDGFAEQLVTADRPSGVVVDPVDGDVFFSEAFDGRIFRVGFGETEREIWVGGLHAGDDDPVGLAIAPLTYGGDVVPPGGALVADFGNGGLDEIWGWSPSEAENEFVVHADDGTLQDCYDIAFAGDVVYSFDNADGTILTLSADGTLAPVATSEPILSPMAIAHEPLTGDLMILDAAGGRIVRLDPVSGLVTDVITGLVLNNSGLIRNWAALDVSADGRELVVSERLQDRVWVFRRCDPAQNDCNDNGIDDICEVADGSANDCNGNGVPDECDVVDGTSSDCDADGIPDECPQCPPVEVVFIFDTSSSMAGEAAELCSVSSQIIDAVTATGIDVSATIWGISDTPGGAFGCLTDDVINALGDVVPGNPPAGLEFLGMCPGGNEVASEDWALAVAVVAGEFAWSPDALRVIIPLSDEGPWCGDRVTDLDEAAIDHAILIANQNDVIVSPISASGSSSAVIALGQALADATGGLRFSSGDSGTLLDGVVGILVGACESISDCNGNGVPDDCDIEKGTSSDGNLNGIPDECECPPDLDGDGMVGFGDLLIALAAWEGPDVDLDGDGVAGFGDLLIILAAWGPCP